MSITLDRWEIQTDGGHLPTVASDDIPAPTLYDTGALGEKKILILEYTYSGDVGETLLDKQIYFNPALYASEGLKFYPRSRPTTGYFCDVLASTVTDQYNPMHFYSGSGTGFNSSKNFSAEMYVDSGLLQFKIKLEFYVTFDLDGYIDGRTLRNVDRWLEKGITNSCDSTVFDADKFIKSYIYILDPADGDSQFTEDGIPVTFRHSCEGLYGGTPEIDIQFNLQRNDVDVTNLSTFEDTTVFVCEDFEGIDHSIAYLLRIDNENNITQDFICDYEIFTDPTQIDKPNVLLLEDGDGTVLEDGTGYLLLEDAAGINMTIPSTAVVEGGRYRILAIMYDTDSEVVNSCISDEYVADGIPEVTVPDFTAEWDTYLDTYVTNSLTVSPLSQVKSKLSIDTTTYDTDITTKTGLTDGFRSHLESLVVELYEEVTSGSDTIKHVVERATITRSVGTSGEVWDSQSSSNNLQITITDTTATDIDIETLITVRDDDTVSNLETQINDVPLAIPQSSQDWVTKSFKLDYIFNMRYDIDKPYRDQIIYEKRLDVNDFDTSVISAVRMLDGSGNEISRNCIGDIKQIEVETLATGDSYNVVAFLQRENFTLSTLDKATSVAGNFDTYTSEILSNVDTVLDAGSSYKAQADIDATGLDLEVEYNYGFILTKI